jgi:predicted dithiol-disulfide oxidoreductase (DUF899 family)
MPTPRAPAARQWSGSIKSTSSPDYFTNGRGVEGLNICTFLDLTPLGRQEDWQDSPLGGQRSKPGARWRRHDEYGKDAAGQHG